MRYFSWNFYNGLRLPILEIAFTDGGQPSLNSTIVSYSNQDIDISQYADWNLSEITQQEALNIAISICPNALVKEDGRIDLMLF